MEIALIENVQREDLNAIEIAIAYQSLINQFSLTQEELSLKVGKSRSHVANFLRLLQLPEEIKQYVSRGTLSMGHARCIAGIKDTKSQKEMAEKAVKEQWSVRELEEAVKNFEESIQNTKNKEGNNKKKVSLKDPYIHQLEDVLMSTFQTTVKIKNKNNRGKIELLYYSRDDLERLLELLQSKSS